MEDLVEILTKFHRDIVVPDIKRIVGDAVDGAERRLRDEMRTIFDALAQQIHSLSEPVSCASEVNRGRNH